MTVWVVTIDGTDYRHNSFATTGIVGAYATEEAAIQAMQEAIAKRAKLFHDLSFSGHYKMFEVKE